MSEVILSVICHKGKRTVFPVHAMKAYTGVEITPLMINTDTKWRSVVSFTHKPLYPQGSSPLAIEYEASWWM